MMDALIESKPIMAQMTCILNQHPHMDFKSSTVLEISQHSGTIDHGETYHDSCRTTMMNSSQVYPSSYWVGYFYSPHGFARVWPLREILHCLHTILIWCFLYQLDFSVYSQLVFSFMPEYSSRLLLCPHKITCTAYSSWACSPIVNWFWVEFFNSYSSKIQV